MTPHESLAAFFSALDKLLKRKFTLTVIGGTAMVIGYESERMTADCDPWGRAANEILKQWPKAQKASGIQLGVDTQAGVAQLPEGFEERLVDADLNLKNLTLRYPEKHDLALSKVARLMGHDLDDILWLHANH